MNKQNRNKIIDTENKRGCLREREVKRKERNRWQRLRGIDSVTK